MGAEDMTLEVRSVAFLIAVSLSLVLVAEPCVAIPLDDFTGYTQGTARREDVAVNFAVLTPGDSFLPSCPIGTDLARAQRRSGLSRQYIHLYQVANTSGPTVFNFLVTESVKATTVGSFDNGNFRLGSPTRVPRP